MHSSKQSILIQYAKNGKFSQMIELFNTKSTQQSQINQEKINEENPLNDEQKMNILKSIMSNAFFDSQSPQTLSEKKLEQLRQNADYLLQLTPLFMLSELGQNPSDILLLNSVLKKHKQLNQLKYALALYREQISMMKMASDSQIILFKFLSAVWIFMDLIAEGKKIMVDVLHIISQFYQLGNSIERKLVEKQIYEENKQNGIQNNQIFQFFLLQRQKMVLKCIETLENKKVEKIDDQSLNLYRKIHVIDLLSYFLTPTVSQVKNQNLNNSKNLKEKIRNILIRYDISFRQLTGNLLAFFVNQLEMFYSKRFCFAKLVDMVLIHLPDSPNQFNQNNPNFLSPKRFVLRQSLKISYKAPLVDLKTINFVIERLCVTFLDDQKFISAQSNFNIDFLEQNKEESSAEQILSQLIKKLCLHLGTGVAPKSQIHKILLNTINNFKGVSNIKRQAIWRNIIVSISQQQKTQLTENQYNFKSFCISQYRKLLTKQTIFESDKQKYIVLMNISNQIKQEVKKVADRHGNLNFLAHLLTMIFYWKKMIQKMINKEMFKISLSQFSWSVDFKDYLGFVSQICLKLKEELRVRQESSNNQRQKSDLLICIFRINELNFQ